MYSRIVTIVPAGNGHFPVYEAGQHATFGRHPDGAEKTFSLTSSPAETRSGGYMEFYLAGEVLVQTDGSEKIYFFFNPGAGGERYYLKGISGVFTLEQQASGYRHILLVATGSGLAPFRSMLRELSARSSQGGEIGYHIILLHGHRTFEELAFYEELQAIEREHAFDFYYFPSVTRRTEGLMNHPTIPVDRVVDLLAEVTAPEGSGVRAESPPVHGKDELRRRFLRMRQEGRVMVMACGNPGMVQEVHRLAALRGIHCVSEKW